MNNDHSCCAPKHIPEHEAKEPMEKENLSQAWAAGFVILAFLAGTLFGSRTITPQNERSGSIAAVEIANEASTNEELLAQVLPLDGVTLPVRWGDTGRQLVATGVIDRDAFIALYERRGGLSADELLLLDGTDNGEIILTEGNSGVVLNLLWAFGLANQNRILDKGPMQNPQYGGAGRFASTGGWTLGVGNAMDHYSAHALVTLTSQEQELVERVAQNIYRPCCGNATHFPDCNHGMAMLGLLELMAAQGADEALMYRAALATNSFWFPGTYQTLAKYFAGQGTPWQSIDPRIVLSADYSSGAGYQRILAEVEPVTGGGGGCGV